MLCVLVYQHLTILNDWISSFEFPHPEKFASPLYGMENKNIAYVIDLNWSENVCTYLFERNVKTISLTSPDVNQDNF